MVTEMRASSSSSRFYGLLRLLRRYDDDVLQHQNYLLDSVTYSLRLHSVQDRMGFPKPVGFSDLLNLRVRMRATY